MLKILGGKGQYRDIVGGEGFFFGTKFLGPSVFWDRKKEELYYFKDGVEFKGKNYFCVYIPTSYWSREPKEGFIPTPVATLKRLEGWNFELVDEIIYISEDVVKDPIKWYENYQKQLQEKAEQEKQEKIQNFINGILQQEMCVGYQVHEFNKYTGGRYLLEKREHIQDGKRIIILHDYLTTCLNHTVIYAVVPADAKVVEIKVPSKLMGLVIGKKGSNIKQIQQQYGLKIILKET